MIRLYQGYGSSVISFHETSLSNNEWAHTSDAAIRLLRARKNTRAADLLEKLPFELVDCTNDFNDEFTALRATVPLERYVKLSEFQEKGGLTGEGRAVQHTLAELGCHVRFIVVCLESTTSPQPVAAPSLVYSSIVVERALDDAAELIRANGPTSAVDRVHTALHGYLHAACERLALNPAPGDSLTTLFKVLRTNHPSFKEAGPRPQDITTICKAMSSILDALNPLRNQTSVAHPNANLLEEPEAMLVINSARTILHYLDAKLGKAS